MSSDRDLVVLGAGMHEWGKWGRNFVEYGLVAARAALADADVKWSEIDTPSYPSASAGIYRRAETRKPS